MSFGGNSFVIPTKSGAFIGLKQIDLTSISQIEISAMAPKAQLNAEGGTIELRMDAPDGKLLGQTAFIGDEPSGGGFNMAGKPVPLNVTPQEGVHDIYLVFQNAKAKAGASLMIVLNTVFKTTDEAPAQEAKKEDLKIDLNDYVGKYKMTGLPFPYIEVTIQDSKLYMKAGEQGGTVNPTNDADKFDANGQAMMQFIRDDKKKVIKLKLEAMNMTFEGTKE